MWLLRDSSARTAIASPMVSKCATGWTAIPCRQQRATGRWCATTRAPRRRKVAVPAGLAPPTPHAHRLPLSGTALQESLAPTPIRRRRERLLELVPGIRRPAAWKTYEDRASQVPTSFDPMPGRTADGDDPYLGLQLSATVWRDPLLAGASPLSHTVDGAGVAAVLLYSLFEEEIRREAESNARLANQYNETYAESVTYFRPRCSATMAPTGIHVCWNARRRRCRCR